MLKKGMKKPRGQAAVTAVILLLVLMLSAIFGASAIALKETAVAEEHRKSRLAFFAAEAGVDDAVYRLKRGKNIGSQTAVSLNDAYATTTITDVIGGKEIKATGNFSGTVRGLKTTLDKSIGTSFAYAVQVGEFGIEMKNQSRIAGSVYSNGSITAEPGTSITGDAWVAKKPESPNTAILTTVDSSGDVGTYTSTAIASDGFARISYVDETNGDLKFARCLNIDCSSKNIAVLDSVGAIGEVTSITLGSDGFARVSYYHDGNDDLKFVRCTDDNCSGRVITIVDSVNNTGDFSSVKMGPDGLARIAYWYDAGGDVRFVQCTNADCSTNVITNVEIAGNVGEYISLAMGSDGFARMSYYDASGKNLKFVRCANAACTSKVITTVDSSGDVGRYTSIVLGGDGFARISYYNNTNDDLKLARCLNADCTSKTITTVDSSGDVGKYASIAIASDGAPRISYYDASNGRLKFARCTSPDCTTKNLSTVSPSGATRGLHASLALGSDGFARISYYNSSSGDLEFALCRDSDCTPAGTQPGPNFIDGASVGGAGLGDAHANTIKNSTIARDAYYQTLTNSTAGGALFPGSADPDPIPLPLTDDQINSLKADGDGGGTWSGDYILQGQETASLGPIKITGTLEVKNNAKLTVTGTVHVAGNLKISDQCEIKLNTSYGDRDGVIVVDGTVEIKNQCAISGSGDPSSHIMILTTHPGLGSPYALLIQDGALGAIFYASKGAILLQNQVSVKELVAQKLFLQDGAEVIYESGLADSKFLLGPGGAWDIASWEEVVP